MAALARTKGLSYPRLGDKAAIVALVAAGVVLRLLSITGHGFFDDMRHFVTWAESLARDGISGYYAAGGDSAYPPVLYLLWPLGRALDDGSLIFAIRALSIPFDVAIGLILYRIGREAGTERQGLWAAGLYLLNPATIVIGPLWGQLDALGGLPMLGSVYATGKGRYGIAAALAAVAVLVKTQFAIAAVLLTVIVGASALRRRRVIDLVVPAAAGAFAAALVLVPLRLGLLHYRAIVLHLLNGTHFGSLFAFNQWAVFGGFLHDDGPWFYVGAAGLVVAAVAALALLTRRHDLVGLLAVGFLIALALYFVPTRVHERYLYAAIVFLAPLAGIYPSLRAPFLSMSVVFTVTLLYVLGRVGAVPAFLGHDLPQAAVLAIVAVAMGSAGWCIWRLTPLFRAPADEAAVRLESAQPATTRYIRPPARSRT